MTSTPDYVLETIANPIDPRTPTRHEDDPDNRISDAIDGVPTAPGRESRAEQIVRMVNGEIDSSVSFAAASCGDATDELIARMVDGEIDSSVPFAAGSCGTDNDADGGDPRAWGFNIDEMNRNYALAIWGGKAAVINEQEDGPILDRVRMMTLEAMNSWFGNRLTEVKSTDGKNRAVTWAKAWHAHRQRRQYAGVEFFPNPDGARGTSNYFNFWRGFDVQPSQAGSYAIFRDHLLTNVCGGDQTLFNYVFGWIAHIIQKPRERLGTALVLRGKRGTGKSKIGEVIGSLFSAHYFQVDEARYVTGQFNAHMASCLLLQADEAVWAGDKAAEGKLKGLITAETQMVEPKGLDPIRMKNYLRIMMTSNESWVVPAGMDERRFCVLDVGDGCAQNHAYFAKMDEQMDAGGREKLLHDLQKFDLKSVDLWRVPRTNALLDQKLRSLDPIDDFWFNRLNDGAQTSDHDGWRDRVAASDLYAEYIKATSTIGIGRKRSPAEFGMRLHKLVPGLQKNRPQRETSPGAMGRVWTYQMPSLTDCRSAFDRMLGQAVDWPALSPEEGERGTKSPADEEVPF